MCMGCCVTALDITVRKDGLTRIQSRFTVMLRLVAYCTPGRHAAVSRGRDVELFVLRGGVLCTNVRVVDVSTVSRIEGEENS